MATYVILSHISPQAFSKPSHFRHLAEKVAEETQKQCPGVRWKASYATMGRFDVVDVVEADDPREVELAAMIIRAFGHATTETMAATPWHDFIASLD